MNLRATRSALLVLLMGLSGAGFGTFTVAPAAPTALTQADRDPTHDPLTAFVGTWTAKMAGEKVPYLVLKIKESNGTLVGTTTHFQILLVGKGKITGNPGVPGESPLLDLKVWGSDLGFTWDGDSRLQSVPAKLSLHGSRRASLVLLLSADTMEREGARIIKESPGASGFIPVIELSRDIDGENNTHPDKSATKWETTFLAALINTAEAQYKAAHGRYVDYSTLVRSGQLKETNGHEFTISLDNMDSETDPLPGYRVDLLLSSDAGSYHLFIGEKGSDCGMALFTDQTGIVFEGRPTGCQAESKRP